MNRHTPIFIFLMMCLLILLLNWNCASLMQVSRHEFMDAQNNIHSYKVDIKKISKTATHYCQKHYVWETIKSKYTKDGIEFLVTTNKGE